VYQLSLDPVAEEQIKAVSQEALRPLAELFTLLETAPWSGQPFNPANPRGNMLTHAFGELGLATYLVLEERREVYLLRGLCKTLRSRAACSMSSQVREFLDHLRGSFA